MTRPPRHDNAPEAAAAPGVRLRTAALWSFALMGGRQLINVLVVVVLAALLGPSAFGTVAVATLYVLLVQQLFQQGLAPALVHLHELGPRQLDVAFRLVVTIGLLAFTATLVLAPGIAAVFDDPELTPVLRGLSVLLVLSALELVPEARLRHESQFKVLALRANVAVLVGGVVGIALAVTGAGVWALVAQQITAGVVSLVLLQALKGWWPRRLAGGYRSAAAEADALLRYSMRASAASAGQFAAQQADSVLVGIFLGTTAVGLYRLAGRLASAAVEPVLRAAQLALLPDLARRRSAGGASFQTRLLQVQSQLCRVTLPAFGVLVGGAPLVPALLGQQWAPAVAPLRLLAVTGAASLAGALVTPGLQALGVPGLLARLNLGLAVVAVLVLSGAGLALNDVGLPLQLTAFAAARAVVLGLIGLLVGFALLTRRTGLTMRNVLAPVGQGAVGLVIVAVGTGVGLEFVAGEAVPLRVIAAAGGGMLGFGAYACLVDRSLVRAALRRAGRSQR